MTAKTYGKESIFGLHGTASTLTWLLLAVALTSQHQLAAAAEAPVPLGRAGNFAVLAGSTVTSTGGTIVNGDLGVSPGTAVTGFPPGIVNGTIHAGDPAAADAQTDLTVAYNDAAGRTVGAITVAGNLGGRTLAPGLYKSETSLEISSGDLTLDASGDANAVWIFQMGSTLVTTVGRQVILSGGAQAANVFWQVGSSATIGVSSVFKGTIMADQSITIATGATLDGRALARIGAVTMDSNLINGTVVDPNNPPVCVIRISCAFTLPNDSNAYVIALKRSGACVILDGSGSSDSDHDPLQISWVVDGTNLHSGATIRNCLALGCHSVLLSVSDGRGGLTGCEADLCVITARDAVDQLISLVVDAELGTPRRGHRYNGSVDKRRLLAILRAAAGAFDRGRFDAGMNQLEAFQRNVRAQLGRTHPASAALFIGSAQRILDAVRCSARRIIGGGGGHHGGDDDDDGGHHGRGDDDDDGDRHQRGDDDDDDHRKRGDDD